MWSDWANGVLNGISAPVDAINLDTLWAWSNAESGADVMRWNNPLNTTQPWPGSIDQNPVGVKYYLSVADGIAATVVTLANGYYPLIIDHLRRSIPRAAWGDACGELGTWGTGCTWLNETFGPIVGTLGGGDMTPEEHQWLADIHGSFGTAAGETLAGLIKALEAGEGAGVALTATQAQQLTDILTGVAAIQAKLAAGLTIKTTAST